MYEVGAKKCTPPPYALWLEDVIHIVEDRVEVKDFVLKVGVDDVNVLSPLRCPIVFDVAGHLRSKMLELRLQHSGQHHGRALERDGKPEGNACLEQERHVLVTVKKQQR